MRLNHNQINKAITILDRDKKDALQVLRDLDDRVKREKYTNVPAEYLPKTKFEDKTANGLQTCITSWFLLNGCKAWRQSSEGRYRPGQQVVDAIGRTRLMKGQYLPGSNVGHADINAIVRGRFVAVEVKIGKDTQSEVQKQYQLELESSGGLYFIARSFESFLNFYNEFLTL